MAAPEPKAYAGFDASEYLIDYQGTVGARGRDALGEAELDTFWEDEEEEEEEQGPQLPGQVTLQPVPYRVSYPMLKYPRLRPYAGSLT